MKRSAANHGWWKANRPIVRFVGTFLVALGAFQFAYYEWIVPSAAFQTYLGANSHTAAKVLRLLGEPVTATSDSLYSTFTMSIRTGCDGLQAMAILAIAVLTFPGYGWRTLFAAAGGIALIAALNVIRIASLFWAGVHWPRLFEPMHVHIWPALLIVVALLYSIAWSAWTTRARTAT